MKKSENCFEGVSIDLGSCFHTGRNPLDPRVCDYDDIVIATAWIVGICTGLVSLSLATGGRRQPCPPVVGVSLATGGWRQPCAPMVGISLATGLVRVW